MQVIRDLGSLRKKVISFMQSDVKGKAETIKNEDHLPIQSLRLQSQPHLSDAGGEKALFCLAGADC